MYFLCILSFCMNFSLQIALNERMKNYKQTVITNHVCSLYTCSLRWQKYIFINRSYIMWIQKYVINVHPYLNTGHYSMTIWLNESNYLLLPIRITNLPLSDEVKQTISFLPYQGAYTKLIMPNNASPRGIPGQI